MTTKVHNSAPPHLKASQSIKLDWVNYSEQACYVCGRKLGYKTPHVAYLIDDDHGAVFVGSECVKKVTRAGSEGLPTHKGAGPRVFATIGLASQYNR